jgi:hypothetical protein
MVFPRGSKQQQRSTGSIGGGSRVTSSGAALCEIKTGWQLRVDRYGTRQAPLIGMSRLGLHAGDPERTGIGGGGSTDSESGSCTSRETRPEKRNCIAEPNTYWPIADQPCIRVYVYMK